jgi:hypothetical protein
MLVLEDRNERESHDPFVEQRENTLPSMGHQVQITLWVELVAEYLLIEPADVLDQFPNQQLELNISGELVLFLVKDLDSLVSGGSLTSPELLFSRKVSVCENDVWDETADWLCVGFVGVETELLEWPATRSSCRCSSSALTFHTPSHGGSGIIQLPLQSHQKSG